MQMLYLPSLVLELLVTNFEFLWLINRSSKSPFTRRPCFSFYIQQRTL